MATKTITGQVQIRNDTAQNWAVENPVLLPGELGLETDTLKGKFGDGETTWNSLPYAWSTTDTTYTAGTGIAISNAKAISNSGVRSIATGSVNGTISVNTNGTAANVAVKGFDDVELKEDASEKYNKLWSMGEQLIINGNGIIGDNTNFSALTFDPVVANASAGSFTREGHSYALPKTDEYIPLSPNSKYELSMDLKSDGTANTIIYAFLLFYDVDKNEITAATNMYIANTLTTLSQDLKAGDTVVHFTDLTNWNVTTTAGHQHGFIFWNYTNSKGYTYPELTYSRNVFTSKYADNSAVDKTNNTITLSSAWTGNTIPAGTKVSQSSSGGSYKYAFSTANLPGTWTNYKGYYDGVDYSGGNATTKMPPGTAYAKLGFLWNYQNKGGQIWATNISLKAVEKDIVYTVDGNKNVTFPAKVTATGGFTGDLTGTASKATSVAIEAGTSNVDRYVWFSWSGTGNEGKACYDAAFKYNPYTDNLTVGKINGMAVNSFVQDTDLSAVATSGSYADLSNKPTIPTVPTNVSAFTNDAGYLTGVSWSQVTGKPGSFTPSAHNQASNTINAMTGYAKASEKAAIQTTDTLNEAIGKLERRLDPTVAVAIQNPGTEVWIEVPVEHIVVGAVTPTDTDALWLEVSQ